MIISVFASYRVLGHEGRTYYSLFAPASDIYDKINVTIPEAYSPVLTEAEDVLLTIDGVKYLLSEVLTNRGDDPVIVWYDGHSKHWRKLPVIR